MAMMTPQICVRKNAIIATRATFPLVFGSRDDAPVYVRKKGSNLQKMRNV